MEWSHQYMGTGSRQARTYTQALLLLFTHAQHATNQSIPPAAVQFRPNHPNQISHLQVQVDVPDDGRVRVGRAGRVGPLAWWGCAHRLMDRDLAVAVYKKERSKPVSKPVLLLCRVSLIE